MKKFYSLLTAVCVLFMVGCSDDDDDKKIDNTYKDSDLVLEQNGIARTGKTVKFSSTNLNDGVITFESIFPGEDKTDITVKMTESTKTSGEYDIEGTSDLNQRKITVTGTVGSKLTANVTIEITSPTAGQWKPMAYNPTAEDNVYTVNFKITPVDENATINMYGINKLQEIPVTEFSKVIGNMAGGVFAGVVDFGLDLKKNGHLVASWAPLMPGLFEKGNSQDGVVYYGVVDGYLHVNAPLMELILGWITARESPALPNLNHLAFKLDKADANILTVSVDKQAMALYLPVIKGLIPQILAKVEIDSPVLVNMGITKESLSQFLPDAIDLISSSKEFTIEINLQPEK